MQFKVMPKFDIEARKTLQMPKKKNRENTRLTHLAKARQKRQRNVEGTPGAWYSSVTAAINSISAESPHGNNVMQHPFSHPESSGDERNDGGALEHAEQVEQPRKRPHPSGQSERTLSRRKKAWKDMAAQGYVTLPNFFVRVAVKAEQKAKLDALVAAAVAKPRSMQNALNIQEEEESEQEDIQVDQDRRTAEKHNLKTAVTLHNHKHTPEPNASKDMRQRCGFNGVDTSCVIEIDAEPIHVESKPSGTVSRLGPLESERACHIEDRSDAGSCQKASPALFEESEESSDGCMTLGDDDEPYNSETPSRIIRRDFDSARANVARMLEERRCGNPDNADFQFVALDNTLAHLRDLAALRAAREELSVIAQGKKLDGILRGRVRAILGLINLFLDEELGYTWRKASLVVAKSQSHSVARARSIRLWALSFLQTRDLPHPKYSGTRSTVLQDEDILHQIQAELAEKTKRGSIKATDLVDVISSPKIQDHLKLVGINRPPISERTAHRWLGTLGWRYGRQKNGMYIDGHEREDVVHYRTAFVQRFKQYERRFHLWDDNGEELPPPRGFHVPEAAGRFRLVLVTHDESTFFQNDQRKVGWDREGSSKAPKPKGDGQSIMVSDFLTVDWGRLRDDTRCVFCTNLFVSHSQFFHLSQ